MKRICHITLFFLAFACAPLWGREKTDVKSKKNELSKIRVELDQTQGQIDSLRSEESKLLGKLKNLDERIALDKEMIIKINRKVTQLRKKQSSAAAALRDRDRDLSIKQGEFRSQLTKVYLQAQNSPDPPASGLAFLVNEEENPWQKVYFSALSDLNRKRVTSASQAARSAQKRLKDVKKSTSQVEKLKKDRAVSASITRSKIENSQRNLTKVRQVKEQAADRLLFLSESARQMNDVIARLEASERQSRTRLDRPQTEMTGLFVAQKGRLKPPIQGKIISGFGWKTDHVTNLKSYSPGIEIKGKPNYNVRAVAPGIIVYIGNLRGYGKFVIVAHDDGYYTTYGGLGRVKVVLDQRIPVREPVGVTGTGLVKFEIRAGKESVDPVAWLDFGALR